MFKPEALTTAQGVDYEPDEFACFSAAMAFVLHKADRAPEFWEPLAVDTITGRQAGQPTVHTNKGYFFLLEQGLALTDVFQEDDSFDEEAYQAQGQAYLDEYYGQKTTEEGLATIHTLEDIEESSATKQLFAPFQETGQYTEKAQTPTLQDILELTNTGLVIAQQDNTQGDAHTVVVIDHGFFPDSDQEYVRYFDNAGGFSGIAPFRAEPLEEFSFIPEDGIVGIKIEK